MLVIALSQHSPDVIWRTEAHTPAIQYVNFITLLYIIIWMHVHVLEYTDGCLNRCIKKNNYCIQRRRCQKMQDKDWSRFTVDTNGTNHIRKNKKTVTTYIYIHKQAHTFHKLSCSKIMHAYSYCFWLKIYNGLNYEGYWYRMT